ncbi:MULTISPECIES: hypothetical protein [Acinetobacter]|uniref:hypothetical protein n=1 Tax=Acinetobacter TaxID=469 RepID=UPI000C5C7AD8|nr:MULTISPECIES: hypothetical protein [Acinetobacter]MBC70453.1 hypothetical protein [Acinetobacter sp.]MBT51741.1 hypothetical protein [Acinetobacter sp.]HIQ36237.1 hypothetical protein [Acinetobacter venetianus]|tara:strand:- start:1271 stop:1534 length:264 start_codon:yes stop_codon:yes gene_type:complete
MDREALNLARRWNVQKMKHWYSDAWNDLIDSLEEFLKLLLIISRLVLSPILMIFYIVGIGSAYKQLKDYNKESRERVRKHIERSEKN